MAERELLFNMDLERFRQIWDHQNWFALQHAFRTENVALSKSLLAWTGESGDQWLLADFGNQKTYEIKMVDDAGGVPSVDVVVCSSEEDQPVTSKDTKDILSHLQNAQGTDQGFIELITRVDIEELDLEALKRSDLSGAGFSFEFLHENLLIVHGMFRDILASSHELLINLSRTELRTIGDNLRQFYETVEEIEGFKISDDYPREVHAELLRKISEFCDSAKPFLGNSVAFLSSRKVDQLESNVNATVAKAVDQLNAETSTSKRNNEEFDKQEAKRQQEFEKIKRDVRDSLAKKSVSHYKTVFSDQAGQHRLGAWIWLGSAILTTVVFFLVFFWSPSWLNPKNDQAIGALQSLFTKGLFLSPIYVWLNRSIKNYTAQKHLEVINTHRQNALETFDAFVAAAGDNRETRDAVLLAATEAIFDANQTGYLPTKATGPDSRSPVQQVIREIIPQKSVSKDG